MVAREFRRIAAWSILLGAMLLVATQMAAAQSRTPEPIAWQFEDIPADVLTAGFLDGHPDLYHRKGAIILDRKGRFAEARERYRMAARYGDKPSQARLGEMYWKGEGGDVDRALGFLWMSLAAERKYEMFEAWKMYYWGQLDAKEQRHAREQDQHLLREYGDAVAKKRQEVAMRRYLKTATGSMLGAHGQALYIQTSDGRVIESERFYARDFWEPDAYWSLQNRVWNGPTPGRVLVGEMENVGEDASPRSPGGQGGSESPPEP